jgi:hypothetical protein
MQNEDSNQEICIIKNMEYICTQSTTWSFRQKCDDFYLCEKSTDYERGKQGVLFIM